MSGRSHLWLRLGALALVAGAWLWPRSRPTDSSVRVRAAEGPAVALVTASVPGNGLGNDARDAWRSQGNAFPAVSRRAVRVPLAGRALRSEVTTNAPTLHAPPVPSPATSDDGLKAADESRTND